MMISSNTRASRSRYSSPAQPQNNGWNGLLDTPKAAAHSSGAAGSRAFMQRWLEPAVQAKASFEDDGLVRYGVLENMAPLGALPKPSKKPAHESGSSAVRRIILRPSGASAASSTTPDAVPKTPAAAASSASPPPPAVLPSPPQLKSEVMDGVEAVVVTAADEDDDDYDPKEAPRRRQSGRASLTRRTRRASGSGGRRGSLTVVAKPTTPKAAAEPKGTRAHSKQPSKQPSKPQHNKQHSDDGGDGGDDQGTGLEDRQFTDKVVEAAVEEALKHYRYPTAWALRALYEERAGDARFVSMLEDVFNQTADPATLKRFSKQVERKKREGKKDNKGCYYFVPPSTSSRFTPRPPKPAPYAHLLHSSHPEELGEGRAAKKAKTSHTRDTPRKMPARGTAASNVRTPTRKRPRRDSASSDSSLSSAMSLSSPEVSVTFSKASRIAAAGAATRTGAGAGAGPEPSDAPKSRPITTRRKSLASKLSDSNSPTKPAAPTSSDSTTKSSRNKNKPAAADASESMPGRVSAAQLFPNLATRGSSKVAKTAAAKADEQHMSPDNEEEEPEQEEADAFWRRRREAQSVTNSADFTESSVRGGGGDDADSQVATPVRTTRKTRQSIAATITARTTRSASKRPYDDVDSAVSPVPWSFPGEASSTVGSRPTTPTTLPLPGKRPRKGLRVKSSPVKKRGGPAAGLPRPAGEAHTPTSNGIAKDQVSDNEEYCSACGNAGDVVCCDGCPRSFHFECVGMATENLPEEWYCYECVFKRFPSRLPVHKGVFAGILNNLEKTNPRAFSLPKKLQTRFEGVKAGADGDYEEVTTTKAARKKNGYEEAPDFFKQREDGQAVLCHDCQKPATEVRSIIPCSVCSLHWHIDCLDPPLAVPPVLKTWRCPMHVEDILAEVPPLGPAHRFRKVKGSYTITPAFQRGTKNNGYIEVDWTDEPEPPNGSGWPDPDSFGRTYKLPAGGIVLDFIEQLRQQGAGYGSRQDEPRYVSHLPTSVTTAAVPLAGSALIRTVEEVQASLNLVSLKQRPSENLDRLISALLASADPAVLSMMTKGSATNIATGRLVDTDKLSLRAMLAQTEAMSARIRHMLGEDAPLAAVQDHQDMSMADTVLSPEDSTIAELHPKDSETLPVTEPTPPSTIDHAEGAMDIE